MLFSCMCLSLFNGEWIPALLAGIQFAVHPVHNEAVTFTPPHPARARRLTVADMLSTGRLHRWQG